MALPAFSFAQINITKAHIAAYDQYVEEVRKDWEVPGLAMTIVKDGKVILKKGYGVRELGKPEPVDTMTLFACASTTKAMTVTLLGMLVDEGRLRWNDPVQKFLPELQLYDPYVSREVTIRDLLVHNTGVGGTDYFTGAMQIPVAEMIRRMPLVKPSYSFRDGFVYQNIMYSFAGRIIERITGKTWAEVIRERIFLPLHMDGTAAKRGLAKSANMTRPHFRMEDTIRVIPYGPDSEIGSAGAVWSNAEDIGKWVISMLDSSRYDGGRLLKPGTWTEIFQPQTYFPADEYPTMQLVKPAWRTYALGWYQHDYKGRKLNFHTGSLGGLTAITAQLPEEGLGIFIFGNLDHAEARHVLMYKALDWFALGGDRDWNSEIKALYEDLSVKNARQTIAFESRRQADTKPSLPLDKYAGRYRSALYGEAEVVVKGDALYFNVNNFLRATLPHWEYDSFYGVQEKTWNGKVMARFTLSQDGSVRELVFGGMSFGR
ncbi:serine hydrolase [Dyadobacter sandarakinus]|uniref:Serine hydrolase n=2 Tax=Dyadobacter sandarakinus TaxID=2747268 RepID=A0ABX7ID81_9BACT|nr:serine hydrolase [Dyadobacter sandarakinus]